MGAAKLSLKPTERTRRRHRKERKWRKGKKERKRKKKGTNEKKKGINSERKKKCTQKKGKTKRKSKVKIKGKVKEVNVWWCDSFFLACEDFGEYVRPFIPRLRFFFFKRGLARGHKFHSLCQDQPTVAHRAETPVAECSLTSCV